MFLFLSRETQQLAAPLLSRLHTMSKSFLRSGKRLAAFLLAVIATYLTYAALSPEQKVQAVNDLKSLFGYEPVDNLNLKSREECDRLAGSPWDPALGSAYPGVTIENIEVHAALVCSNAAAAFPNNARMTFQLARSIRKGGDLKKAMETLNEAATMKYPPAMFELSLLFAEGVSVPRNEVLAFDWRKLQLPGCPRP